MDRGSKRGHGQGRGRGYRGRGGHGGQTQTIKNLERAAADIQTMLQKMTTKDEGSEGNTGSYRKKGTRGSKSLMDISFQDDEQWNGPPNRGPPNQDRYYPNQPNQGPPYPNIYHQGPPNQGPYYTQPASQGPYPPYPPVPNHYNQGQPNQDPYLRSHSRGPPNQFPPPPPSYEESVQQHGMPRLSTVEKKYKSGGKMPECETFKVNAQQLVKALALFEGQMADTETLSKQVESSTKEVERVVQQRKDIFAHMKDGAKVIVELVPNIKLCSYYLSGSGCTARDTCHSLHLCKDYILTRCDQGPSCPFGHKVDTNHNASILSKMYLDLIKISNLISVIRKVCRGNAPPRICSYHNSKDGCRKVDNCRFLHICNDYVMNGGSCTIKGCTFNHQLTHKQCKNVLTQHGVSTNESIRDILLLLKSSLEKTSQNNFSGAVSGVTRNKNKGQDEDSEEESSDSDTSQNCTDRSVKKKRKNKSCEKSSRFVDKAQGRSPTIRSTDLYGDVEIPEICIYAVNDKCTNEKKGCKYLHAKSLFHWQVQKGKKWYNFRIFQSKILESAYRDVSKGGVKIPPIDAGKLGFEEKKMLEILGTNSWKADFKEMCITDPANNKLNIRRVSTQSAAVSNLPQATVYEWYFVDEQGKWICYGQVDSLGKQDLVCNITSEDIEKEYVNNPSLAMIISNAHYKYKIDFATMTQMNLSSNKVREIRRRPSRLSYQKQDKSTTSTDLSLPSHWQPMSHKQTHILIDLNPSQTEFQDVCKSIKLMIPTAKIHGMRRLQNRYLWCLLQYKKADLSQRYDDLTMNVQKLYHGTDSNFIDAICKENIDGRRYNSTKDKFGKGTYFSNSPAIASTYCTRDPNGHFFLVMAEVIIGYVTVGSKSLNRPPTNAATGHYYDTTVDNSAAPTIFVKYDKEEYYPEYIIEIST